MLTHVDTHPTARQLLESALVIIDRDGIDALTVRALVVESGVSNGSVYHHLGSLDRLRCAAADEAIRIWSADFLAALRRRGYAAAAAADHSWSRAHPGLARLIDDEGRRGRLGLGAQQFSSDLRAWLDSQQLAIGAPGHLVAAIMIAPLIELRRLEHATGRRPTDADFNSLDMAVRAALAAVSR
jgi:AcrR family transcriptional regulator